MNMSNVFLQLRRSSASEVRRAKAFTLVELMVSVALALILLLGVNAVFRITSETIGSGTALNTAIRSDREASAVIFDDLRHAVMPGDDQPSNAPFFAIRSERVAAFPDANAEHSDLDYMRTATPAVADRAIRTVDVDGNATEGEFAKNGSGFVTLDETSARTALDSRNHRIDQICFFTRGQYRRQTANDGATTLVANQTTPEAWIWYGQLKQPDGSLNVAGAFAPGEANPGTNVNNAYGRQWNLGRMVMCLAEPIPPTAGSPSRVVLDAPDTTQSPAVRTNQQYIGRSSTATNTSLSPLAQSSQTTTDGQTFDGSKLIQYSRFDVAGTTINKYRGILITSILNGNSNWWNEFPYRFSGYPKPNRPLDATGLARTVPCMIPGCTQFAVEYAGDFVAQDATGKVTSVAQRFQPAADGITDFYIDGNGIAKTRWYGFPRDTSGDGKIISKTTADLIPDVVPLRDIAGQQPFERDVPTLVADYADHTATSDVMANTARYWCVWGPDTIGYPVPKMIRFVVTVDDPLGRMSSPQTYEYVVEIP